MSVSTFHDESRQRRLRTSCVCHGENDPQKEVKLTKYYQALNYLLATYATDDVIAREKDKLRTSRNPSTCLLSDIWMFYGKTSYVAVVYVKEPILKKLLLEDRMRQLDSQ